MGMRTKSKPSRSSRSKSSSWMCRRRISPRASDCDSQWLTLVPRLILKLLTVPVCARQGVNAKAMKANSNDSFFISVYLFDKNVVYKSKSPSRCSGRRFSRVHFSRTSLSLSRNMLKSFCCRFQVR